MPPKTEATDGTEKLARNLSRQAGMVSIVALTTFFYGFNRGMIAAIVNSESTG